MNVKMDGCTWVKVKVVWMLMSVWNKTFVLHNNFVLIMMARILV